MILKSEFTFSYYSGSFCFLGAQSLLRVNCCGLSVLSGEK